MAYVKFRRDRVNISQVAMSELSNRSRIDTMLIVRETFTAKPGQAGKLAKLMKEVLESVPGKCRVLTDVVADLNTVVLETEVEDLAAFEKRIQQYMADESIRQKMQGYTDMYITGRREIYRIW